MIIPGSASQTLAAALARETGRSLVAVDRRRFPDGEQLVTLGEEPDGPAVVVASTVSDATFVELLLLQDAAREAGASPVTTVVPYLGYARQDRQFEPGQPISVRAMARAIASGTDRVITVDPHEPSVLDRFGVPARAVSGAASLATALPTDLTDPLFVGPDEGARELVGAVRDRYGTGTVSVLVKTRRSDREVEIDVRDVSAADRDVVLVDDIIATGGTMSEAVTALSDRGAERVFATCVHPLLADAAYADLSRAGVAAILGTDTIERPVSRTSVAPVIAEALAGQP